MSIEKVLIFNDKIDTVDTPPPGKVYFYSAGGVVFSKDSSGAVLPLGGLSVENIQDMLSTFITAGSSRQYVAYDDVLNVLTLDVNEANIIHQNLSGAGTNTHGQIDLHIANTSNPHGVTKAQIGLSDVDNTSDASKPVSIATQTQLDLKEPIIVAGTALEYLRGDKFFSNFQDSVRLTVLTGLSILVSTAVTAADNILVAIGKLQAQINLWSELVLVGALNNSSNVTLTNIAGLLIPVVAGRTYKIEATILFRSAAANTGIALTMGNTGAIGTLSMIASIPAAADGVGAIFHGAITAFGDTVTSPTVPLANTDYVARIDGIFICTTGGTITPQFRSEVNGNQVTVQSGSVILSRVF